jgi:hypothetical protein
MAGAACGPPLEWVMQKAILIALTLVVSSAGFASSSAGFTGGRGDGYAHGDFIMLQLTSVASHFLGGGRDGYAHGDFITPQLASVASHFLGGGRDGYDSCIYQQVILSAQKRFTGNGYDGYASARFFSVAPPAWLAQFSGGNSDGYASSKQLSLWQQTQARRFFGGSFDGYDRNASFGIPNWVLGDTDANGLPDWWELQYFDVLTGTPTNGDADHDGASNLFEYLTGTNPTNAISYFHITRLTPGSPKKIFVYCAPGFFYTLQRADDLTLGWTVVTNQTQISPAAEGVFEMDDFFSGTSGFYRVLLEH